MEDTSAPVDVYVGSSWQAGQVQELLENAGITALLKDEVMGRIDAPALKPGSMGCVKVMVSGADHARAEQVIRDYVGEKGLLGEPASEPIEALSGIPWTCPSCGEQVEAQFGACWNCGAQRP
jgi:hypothetical protein